MSKSRNDLEINISIKIKNKDKLVWSSKKEIDLLVSKEQKLHTNRHSGVGLLSKKLERLIAN